MADSVEVAAIVTGEGIDGELHGDRILMCDYFADGAEYPVVPLCGWLP
jgi:hypothetical protein